eukprot:6071906-Ditylum_brightwellii.AAC.1
MGVSDHYIRTDAPHRKDKTNKKQIAVGVPNGESVQSKYACKIELGNTPQEGKTGYIIKDITTNLVSIGRLCDTGCKATFSKDGVVVKHNGKQI